MEGLQALPARMDAVESQILQLRGEMRDGFSAIDKRFEAVDKHFGAVDARLDDLKKQIKEGDEETKRYMRVLHEEVLSRIATLQEGRKKR